MFDSLDEVASGLWWLVWIEATKSLKIDSHHSSGRLIYKIRAHTLDLSDTSTMP